MDVKLELYRTFREVARRGSFSAAAEALFISQSAVSQSIKNLESQLGVALFDRRGKQIALTPEGRLLYGYIDEGLKSIRQGEEQLGQYAKLEKGELKIGVSDTISRFVILNQLDSFHRIYPYIHLSIINGTSIEAATWTLPLSTHQLRTLRWRNIPFLKCMTCSWPVMSTGT